MSEFDMDGETFLIMKKPLLGASEESQMTAVG